MNEHDKILEIIRLRDEAPLDFDPEHAALLVIDVQRYFVGPEHPFAQVLERLVPGSTAGYFGRVRETVLPNVERLLGAFRARRLPVVFTGTGSYTEDGGDLPRWLRDFDRLGLALLGRRVWPRADDPSWQIDEAVAPRPGEIVLHKTTSGPLNSTRLDQLLHNMGVTSLVVAGLTTDVCVTQTARETADRGFRVLIAGDACTTLSEEMHRAALQAFSLAFGRVRQTGEVVSLVSASVRPGAAAGWIQ
jgi:nicotinamidase-related amidase